MQVVTWLPASPTFKTQHVKLDYALPTDENGMCVLANEVSTECEGKVLKSIS